MSKVITVSAIKGGCGKTTSSAIISWLLAEQGYKTLAICGDPQGNLTENYLLEPVRELRLRGVKGILQAVKEGDAKPYIQQLTPNLDLLLGEEIFGTLPEWLFLTYKGNKSYAIKTMLDKIKNDYDFVICDTAPTLNHTLVNFLAASDYTVAMFEASKFSYSALFTLYETILEVQETVNSKLSFLGILCSLVDTRRADNKEFVELVKANEDFGPLCFETIITRKATTGRLAFAGFFNNPELNQAVEQYRSVVKELVERVSK
jgi:chromosome partitioning protein